LVLPGRHRGRALLDGRRVRPGRGLLGMLRRHPALRDAPGGRGRGPLDAQAARLPPPGHGRPAGPPPGLLRTPALTRRAAFTRPPPRPATRGRRVGLTGPKVLATGRGGG